MNETHDDDRHEFRSCLSRSAKHSCITQFSDNDSDAAAVHSLYCTSLFFAYRVYVDIRSAAAHKVIIVSAHLGGTYESVCCVSWSVMHRRIGIMRVKPTEPPKVKKVQ